MIPAMFFNETIKTEFEKFECNDRLQNEAFQNVGKSNDQKSSSGTGDLAGRRVSGAFELKNKGKLSDAKQSG